MRRRKICTLFCVLSVFLITGIIFAGNRTAFARVFVSENWDSGTPSSNWPCKRLGTACDDGVLFNGWYGRGFDCNVTSGKQSGRSSTRAHSGTYSYYQHRESGATHTCDLRYNFSEPYPTTIYVRFYVYFETGWNSAPPLDYVHWIFFNSAVNSGNHFRLNLIGDTQYGCDGKKLVLSPEGTKPGGGESKGWEWGNEDWGGYNLPKPICEYDMVTLLVGKWTCLEYKLEITGTDRVTITEWINGVQTRGPIEGPGEHDGYFSCIIISGWNNIGANYVGGFYIDDIVVADSYIGPSNMPPSTPPPPGDANPPSAPSGLRIIGQ